MFSWVDINLKNKDLLIKDNQRISAALLDGNDES